MHVPLVTQYAYAGYARGYADPEYIEDLPRVPYFVEREYKGNYMAFEVVGDSMFAERIGMSPTGLFNVLSSERKYFTVDQLAEMCIQFDVSAEWLLLGKEEGSRLDEIERRLDALESR